ncbi:MAG: DUF3365 domain-containing protein [Desulfacinum sp.]|nr:DUF3365 domain-containing protein [Desulfacinum sp.]
MARGRRRCRSLGGVIAAILFASSLWAQQPPAEEQARQLGNRAADELMSTLKKELGAAMKSGGPGRAIRVCSQRALLLTQEIPHRMQVPGMELKRTTLRWRNERNRPDDREEKVLRRYEQTAARKDPLEPLLVLEDGFYHYYQPIKVSGLCLMCHGPEERMADTVRSTLDTLYPEDKARNYGVGDFRGVVHVSFPQSAVSP